MQKYERRRKVPQNCFKKWAKKLLKHFPKNKEKKLQKAREKNSIIGPKSTTTKKCQKLQGREVTKIHSQSKKVAKDQRSAKKKCQNKVVKKFKKVSVDQKRPQKYSSKKS